MFRYVSRRILMMIPVLLGVTLLIFFLLYISPGDPAQMILGSLAPTEDVEALREEMGLNDPFLVRYGNYLVDLLHGDMGQSYTTGKDVAATLIERYPTTILLATAAVGITIVIGIPLGILSAIKQYSVVDMIVNFISMIGVSMPNFWNGLLLILIFSVQLGLLPASGFYGPKYWILPAFSIGFSAVASCMRNTRSSVLECIREDYVQTAKAKGQKNRKIITHHVLKNALIPIITDLGTLYGGLLGGAILTESIFAIPGLGKFLVEAINQRDYPTVQGGVLLIALSYSVVNLFVDLLYAFVDPRIRSQYKAGSRRKLFWKKESAENG